MINEKRKKNSTSRFNSKKKISSEVSSLCDKFDNLCFSENSLTVVNFIKSQIYAKTLCEEENFCTLLTESEICNELLKKLNSMQGCDCFETK